MHRTGHEYFTKKPLGSHISKSHNAPKRLNFSENHHTLSVQTTKHQPVISAFFYKNLATAPSLCASWYLYSRNFFDLTQIHP